MKKNIIRAFATLLISGLGYFTVENYTGKDITLEDGTTIKTKELSHHLNNRYRERDIDTVYIYLHHTVTKKDASVESINQIHINNGWEKLSYHVLTRYNAKIQLINDFTKYTYHTKGKNKKGLAVALVGNYEEEEVTEEMEEATRYVMEKICELDFIYVKGILPHNAVKNTLCPGKNALEVFSDLFYDEANN